MNEKELAKMANEFAKNIKTTDDLTSFTSMLTKQVIEAALGAEMEEHLGYSKNQQTDKSNNRNGYTKKILKGSHGEVEIATPRDRNGSFEPQLIKKRQNRLTQFDEQITYLYGKGMTTRDITDTFEELYGAQISPTLVSKVTAAVIEKLEDWQARGLEDVYPIIYLDCIHVSIRHEGRVHKKAIYVALGITMEGHKEVLGLWISKNEGAKFWLSVLTDLQNRGLQDVLIFCVDGLSGFPEAIEAVYPKAKVQLCIVHMVRNSVKYVGSKHQKEVCSDLRTIYSSVSEKQASKELEKFKQKWNDKYPAVYLSWYNNWKNLITIFEYPADIRKVIYTTNAIESLNSVIRKAIKNRRVFPHDESALKTIFLAVEHASKKWTMPIRNWKPALNRFVIEFEGRIKIA
ncbi:MAG: IS256 family transposase [Alcanivoracaceae bacterium]|nr:IS256 family transposase [Alcanivoracaceae bacterium]